jgi:signal transduction histidine kinase
LVDDLVELSRIHAGVLRLEPGTGLLADLVGEVLAAAEPGARAGGVLLASTVEPGLEVHADPVALARVLENLVGNAVRHTPAGGRVEVTGQVVGEQVRLRVSDGCGGLAEDDLARVLEVGWQAGGARTPSAQPLTRGGGLGLAIVAGLVEAHGGHVHAENQPAGPGGAVPGCRFVVTLPPC